MSSVSVTLVIEEKRRSVGPYRSLTPLYILSRTKIGCFEQTLGVTYLSSIKTAFLEASYHTIKQRLKALVTYRIIEQKYREIIFVLLLVTITLKQSQIRCSPTKHSGLIFGVQSPRTKI